MAIKILEKAKIKDVTDVERVSRELHILKITQHSSIAQMYEIIETEQNIFIVMEYAPRGEFFDYIMDGKMYPFFNVVKMSLKPIITLYKLSLDCNTCTS